MSADFEQVARLKFMTVYNQTLQQLTTDIGAKVCEFNAKGVLSSSMFFNARNKVAIEAAKSLSQQRLEIDVTTLRKFGISIKSQTGWLEANQHQLLLGDFWNRVFLGDFRNAKYVKFNQSAENYGLEQLKNILQDSITQITALGLEPEEALPQPPVVNHNIFNSYNGQQNIATDNGIVNATQINNNTDIEQLATKLAELLKASDLPDDIKEEAIDLAETVAEQSKAGQPRKGVLKSLGNALQVIKDTDSVIKAGKGLYETANQLGELIKPLIS